MKSLRLIGVGLIAASAVWGSAQHGRGDGPPSGMGSSGRSSSGMGSSGRSSSDHGAPTSQQSKKPSPEQLLNQNTKLSSNLQKLLPAGTTPQQACTGFKNLGQCVAAIHVSHNLGIPFSDLQAKMTGSKPESLGKAIQDLKPEANVRAEKKKAEKQAKNDIDGSNS
jgi:hypothetical protein